MFVNNFVNKIQYNIETKKRNSKINFSLFWVCSFINKYNRIFRIFRAK